MPGPHILWLLHRVLLTIEQKKVAGWHSPLVYLRRKVEGHNKEPRVERKTMRKRKITSFTIAGLPSAIY